MTLALFIGLKLAVGVCELNSALAFNDSGDGQKQSFGLTEENTSGRISSEVSSVKCNLQAHTRRPAFSMHGDYVIGGVFSIHHYKQTAMYNYTTIPEPQKCTGRSVRGWSVGLDYVTLCGDGNVLLSDVLTVMIQSFDAKYFCFLYDVSNQYLTT